MAVRDKQLTRLKTAQLKQLESTRSDALSIALASAAVAVNSTVGELSKQKDEILSSTVEGLLRSKDEECAAALHNLSREKDHEYTLALQQMCAEKDVIMSQEKIAMEGRISLLTKKNDELNILSVQAAVAVLRKALMGGSHKEELFEIANEIISSCSDPETGVATLSWSNTSNSIGKNSVRYVLQIFSKRFCYVFSYISSFSDMLK